MLPGSVGRGRRAVEDQAALRPLPPAPAPLRRDGADGVAPVRVSLRGGGPVAGHVGREHEFHHG